jgi:heme a synthase
MRTSDYHPWLSRFAVLTAVATLLLIGVGGVVTSKGHGLAVPDWPTSYGYNMFLFPFSKMVGGIFYEHSHRLVASAVGLLTLILAGWIAWKDERPWMRKLGWIAFLAVVFQGVLGGLRVVWLKDEIGIFHACLAQGFFVLIGAIALFSTRWWSRLPEAKQVVEKSAGLKVLLLATTLLIFLQLVLGAIMRHEHAGLSIPDFPLAYGKVIPPMDAVSLGQINAQRRLQNLPPTETIQIALQFFHRIAAFLILAGIVWSARRIHKTAGTHPVLRGLSRIWIALVAVQIVLGASTVWTNKAADIATAHVVIGALTLLTGSFLFIIAVRCIGTPDLVPAWELDAQHPKIRIHDLRMVR